MRLLMNAYAAQHAVNVLCTGPVKSKQKQKQLLCTACALDMLLVAIVLLPSCKGNSPNFVCVANDAALGDSTTGCCTTSFMKITIPP
jgi:hypothetical protein